MKIAVYWEQNEWGGVDSHLLTLIKSWPSLDDEFVIICNTGNPGLQRIREELVGLQCAVQIEEISSWSFNAIAARLHKIFLGRWLIRILYFVHPVLYFLMSRRLEKVLSPEIKFDVLMANNGGYPAAWGCLSAVVAAKRIGIPSRILLVHHEANKPDPFLGWFEYYIDRTVTKKVTAIACPSYATRRTLLERRAINAESVTIRVIHNEADVEATDGQQVVDISSNIGAGKNAQIIGIVGRVEPYKGHEDIICALSRLPEKDVRNIEFVIIGSGNSNEIERLRTLAQRLKVDDKVHFLGYLPGNSVDLIRQLDLLIVATRSFEGYGLTLVEAIRVKTPVLASRVGAVPEFINEEVGSLYAPGSPREIAQALSSFVNDRNTWMNRAETAYVRMGQTVGVMAEDFHRMFTECRDGT